MNPAFKHFAERALVGSGAGAVARRRLRTRTLILAYHNVFPDGAPLSGDRSLHLPRREFARQLDHVAQCFEVVPLEALASALVDERPRDRPRVIITFDDAYAGALTDGLDELAKRRMPATIFVAPALLGVVPWWDTLAEDYGGAVPATVRNHALDILHGRGESVLESHLRHGRNVRSHPHLPRIGTEAQLARAAAQPGISWGSHTWSHANLRSLPPEEMERQLTRPLEWLRARFSNVVSWVSYPYGLFATEVEIAAKRTGHTGALRIDGGWIRHSHAPMYSLPRLNIPSGISIDGFRLRLAGL